MAIVVKIKLIFFLLIRAHRQRLSVILTHKAPAATVPCCRGTAASNPRSTRRGQSPSARLRRTLPTLTKDHLPNRLPMQRLSFAPCLFAAPKGVHAARRWAVSAAAPCARQLQPHSLPSFAPPSSTQNKMRPAMPTQRQKTATLRRSGSFGFGRFGVALRLLSASGRSAGRQHPTHIAITLRVICSLLFPSAALALAAPSRPCRKPCARPCTSPSGWLAVLVPSRKCGTAFARCASKIRRSPSLPAVVRTEARASDKAPL